MRQAQPLDREEFWKRQGEIETARAAEWAKLSVVIAAAKGDKKKEEEAHDVLVDWQWKQSCLDPWFFLRTLVTTHDEHADVEGGASPYQPFPSHRYLEIMTREWQMEPLIAEPKSRQVMMSWLHSALYMWRCMTQDARGVAKQSKKEDDAYKLCKRAHGIWSRFPERIKQKYPCTLHKKPPVLEFANTNSVTWGVAQGGDQIRMNTVSDWWSDEMAFQEEVEEAYTAAQPCIDGGGRAALTSSAAPGFFWDVCEGRLGEDDGIVPGSHEVLLDSWSSKKGVVAWRTFAGWRVLRIHYSADPTKTKKWAMDASRKYGGMKSKRWRAEMEIDPEARYAGRVYPEFDRSTHVVEAFSVPDEWPRWWGIDPGFRNPCACLLIAMDGDGTFWVIDEIYKAGKTVPELAAMIKAHTGRQEIEYYIIDSQAKAKTLEGGGKSVAEKFEAEGIETQPGTKDVNTRIEEVASLMKLQGDGEPRFKVFDTCQNTIEEHESYRWMELSSNAKATQDEPERPVKKRDHTCDAAGYVVHNVSRDYYKRYGKHDPYRLPDRAYTPHARYKRDLTRRRESALSSDDGDLWDD